MNEPEPVFFSLADIIHIHENQIEFFGGEHGIRDFKLLHSALGIVKSTFDREFLHRSIFEMASAYCFHICMNHPFVDGNKRVALMSALIFLDLNGYEIHNEKGVYDKIMHLICGKVSKQDFADFLEELAIKR